MKRELMRFSDSRIRACITGVLHATGLFTGGRVMGALPDEFKAALTAGYAARLKPLLDDENGEPAWTAHGLTLLYCAALADDQDCVRWLLKQGADPTLRSTALFHFNEDEPDSF